MRNFLFILWSLAAFVGMCYIAAVAIAIAAGNFLLAVSVIAHTAAAICYVVFSPTEGNTNDAFDRLIEFQTVGHNEWTRYYVCT